MTQHQQMLRAAWLALQAAGGRLVIPKATLEEYPGHDQVWITTHTDPASGDFTIEALRYSDPRPSR